MKAGESENPCEGTLFVVSAPSGAGKTTIIRDLLARPGMEEVVFSVSHTTRAPRSGERSGRDYHFVDQAGFREMVAAGDFLEWAEVHGNLYGTSWAEVRPRLEAGIDVLLDIDVQGAQTVLERVPEAASVFILPPSFDELTRRLRGRGLDDEATVARRLRVASWECRHWQRYRYVIVNEEVRRACDALLALFVSRRQARERMRPQVERILAAFPEALEPHSRGSM